MVAATFPKALALVLKSEGGNDDDPADHGGRTSRGVTQATYDAWRELQGRPKGDVWKATDQEVATIYHDHYWLPWCDAMPTGVDYLFFDLAVNGGPHRAAVMLQRALGVPDDGAIGPQTQLALKKANPEALIRAFTTAKRAWYVSLHQPRFVDGWLNRCNSVEKDALRMLAA